MATAEVGGPSFLSTLAAVRFQLLVSTPCSWQLEEEVEGPVNTKARMLYFRRLVVIVDMVHQLLRWAVVEGRLG